MEVKRKIKAMMDEGHADIAKLLIREYEGQYPYDADICSWKADICLLENKLDDAQRFCIQALGFEHDRPGLLVKLAEIYRRSNQPVLSESLLRNAFVQTREPSLRESIQAAYSKTAGPSRSMLPDERPLVSIIVLAYNHVEYTKRCIDSIFRYTSHLPIELITVDNGSTDGTAAYFSTLPHDKKVVLQTNAGPVNGFNAGMLAAEGQFTACISNDFIVTAAWLDNLLACISSDSSIGFVSPGANSISNNQRIECPETELESMQEFALAYNKSDSSKWEERVRLLPCVLMVRTEVLHKVGYYDPRFAYGEFADDDLSFRIRRAGYKLVFAKDTFIYHYGSVTTGEEQRKYNSLGVSRVVFQEKHGIDAWDDASYDIHLVEAALAHMHLAPHPSAETAAPAVKILGVNARCGGTPLQLGNFLRAKGIRQVQIHNYTDQSKYLDDLDTVSDTVQHNTLEMLGKQEHGKFDAVLLEGGLVVHAPVEGIILSIRKLLKSKGIFVFKVRNSTHFLELARLFNIPSPGIEPKVSSTCLHIHPLMGLMADMGMPVRKLLFVQDAQHVKLTETYQRLEQLLKADEAFNTELLSVSEILVVAEAE
jgi:O-antigen biosynthesis protein